MAKERMISVDEAIINNTLSSEAVKIDNLHKSYGKKEVIKGISEKVLEMTLEIKEMEHEIEKIKKEWHLD